MSKNHRNNRKPALADWAVLDPQGNQSLITESRFTRDQHGGYTFTDKDGVTADFPPGTVLHVLRQEPAVEVIASMRGSMAELHADMDVLDSRA